MKPWLGLFAALICGALPAAASRITLTGAGSTFTNQYPFVVSSAATANASLTNAIVNLPPSYASGDLLLVLGKLSNGSAFSTPSGWTLFYFGGTGPQMWAYYKVSNGGEGSTLTITQPGASTYGFVTYAIRNYSGSPVAASPNPGNMPSLNPPPLTSGFGVVPTLWIAHMVSNNSTLTGYPSGYTDTIVNQTGTANLSAAATLATTAASEDPGPFTGTGTVAGNTNTIAIKGP